MSRLIDADALINETMERYCSDCERRKGVKNGKWKIVYSIGDAPCRACGIGDMIDELEDAPTIEERKKGKWIHDGYDFPGGNDWIHCSECGKCGINVPADLTKYCPNCGARMESENETKNNIH